MKLRSGFISNSSSSSFIIAIDKDISECPHCHRKDKNILDLVQEKTSDCGDDTGLKSRGKDEAINFVESQGFDSEECQAIKTKIETAGFLGMDIGVVEISYHDDLLNDKIREMEKAGTIKILLKN